MGELASESQGSKDLGKWMPICPSGNSHSLFFWLFFFFCHECVHSYTDLQLHLFLHTLYTSGINLQCCNVTGPFKKCVRGLTQKDFFIRIPTELFSSLSSQILSWRNYVSLFPQCQSLVLSENVSCERTCEQWMHCCLYSEVGTSFIYSIRADGNTSEEVLFPKKKKFCLCCKTILRCLTSRVSDSCHVK